MSQNIKDLKPNVVWRIFYDLTQIPRPSKKEKKAAEYVKKFGEKLGLKTIVDDAGNVIIKKPATPGMEKRKGVILQSHLDMVPQKNSDKKHDFEKDPIEAYVDGEWVKAKGTTLGSDNGIGVATTLAVLESKMLQHGPLEALFTVDEETGMTGAFNLKPGLLDGKILLNLDSEDEGELCIGCAGGMNTTGIIKYKTEPVPADSKAWKLGMIGLKGGHSGVDINLGRANSNRLLNRFMMDATKRFKMRLASIDGGSLRNAIPRESFAIVTVHEKYTKDFISAAKAYQALLELEIGTVETDLKFTVISTEMPESVMIKNTQMKLLRAVYGIPNGVIRMSTEMPDIVETSYAVQLIPQKKIWGLPSRVFWNWQVQRLLMMVPILAGNRMWVHLSYRR
jgi:dipeptidase D